MSNQMCSKVLKSFLKYKILTHIIAIKYNNSKVFNWFVFINMVLNLNKFFNSYTQDLLCYIHISLFCKKKLFNMYASSKIISYLFQCVTIILTLFTTGKILQNQLFLIQFLNLTIYLN